MKPVVTVSDLEPIKSGGELGISSDAIITPLARDEAAKRNITLRVVRDAQDQLIPGVMPPKASDDARRDPTGRKIVAVAADHGGYELKQALKRHLQDWGYAVLDLGTHGTEPVDYPDFAAAAAEAVVSGRAWRAIIIDSAGIGSAIAANKIPGARAALCYDRATARNSREHNDANVLSLGAKLLPAELAREIAAVWLETKFGGGRHEKRVDKIRALESRYSSSSSNSKPENKP
jgi:ribose 5-phosphate isomerase B